MGKARCDQSDFGATVPTVLAELAWIDTALDHRLRWYIGNFEKGHPDALQDAIEFCSEQDLFVRTDLTDKVMQLVGRVLAYAAAPVRSRRRKPKGVSTRATRGRPADAQKHVRRYEKVEEYLETAAAAGTTLTVTAAAKVVGGSEHDAYRKSYWLVVHGRHYNNYYEPEYVSESGESK